MSKRILIMVGSYEIGGTVVSLHSLLSVIRELDVRVDLFCRLWRGDYKGRMPNCTVLPENVWLSHRMTEAGVAARAFNLLLWTVRKAFGLIGFDLFRIYCRFGGRQIHSLDYDAVIGFDEGLAPFISYMPARKRINWIHCDYRRYAGGRDESGYYSEIHNVVCVSEFVKGIFCGIYPQFASKTVAIHNVINVADINAGAGEPIDDDRFDTASFTLVSCGRLDPVKQFSLIPSIVGELLRKTRRKFKWYIIGEGEDRINIERQIEHYSLADYIILLGRKPNPYPYMAKADLYVCTSLSESFPLAVNEAKALCVPVLCSEFPSASESVTSREDGVTAPVDAFPTIIADWMEHPVKGGICTIDNSRVLEQLSEIFQ